VDDLLDQFERMLRARAETHERNIRLFAGCDRSDLADVDLGGDHLVPEVSDKVRHNGQAVMTLVRHEHA
jgi:hypothetical protein